MIGSELMDDLNSLENNTQLKPRKLTKDILFFTQTHWQCIHLYLQSTPFLCVGYWDLRTKNGYTMSFSSRTVAEANVPPGFPTSTMLRSFQGVLGATDPRDEGQVFVEDRCLFWLRDPFVMYLVGCVFCIFLLVFSCEFLRFIAFQLNFQRRAMELAAQPLGFEEQYSNVQERILVLHGSF